MQIRHVEIGNFRKLQAVRIDFAETTTLFVGANNSGKTAAMIALRRFLIDRGNLTINDFTLTHWNTIDDIGIKWENPSPEDKLNSFEWGDVIPFIDVWLQVPMNELHYVQKLLPSLDWNGENIGVRLRYEPKKAEDVQQEYLAARRSALEVMEMAGSLAKTAPNVESAESDSKQLNQLKNTSSFTLWPSSLVDFISRRMHAMFEVRAYLLDPSKFTLPESGIAQPQTLPIGSEPIDGDPFQGLIQIDEIGAQRGFGISTLTKARSDNFGDEKETRQSGKKLSNQLRSYYANHLDPFNRPEAKDLQALQALHVAQTTFGTRLEASFSNALNELDDLGYPGVTDPKLKVSANIRPVDGLNHSSAVQYEVPTYQAEPGKSHKLPEESNGLGYQNLVSMVFELMSFRDKWMKVGKASLAISSAETHIAPLHLVLIEEPEAHLHAQVQQVFIKQAYGVLRNHEMLKKSKSLQTQLIISTHSSNLAHAADFSSLRYFRRLPAPQTVGAVPVSSVVNLSEIFGGVDPTVQFVKRYLKATHCDLFFADGAILIEGPAERILIPPSH